MKASGFPLVLALLTAILPTIARADSNTVLQGRVYDGVGHPVVNALVQVASQQGLASLRSGTDGRFVFFGLLPGIYTVSVQKDGYNPASLPGVGVSPGETEYAIMHLRQGMHQWGWGWSQRGGSSYVIY